MRNREYYLFLIFLPLMALTGCGQNQKNENSEGLNRLRFAGSPYLLEHADNPVDWYEWGPVALEKAKKENKPLIISIGYAACHWCHVMERESFMDTAVARLMNENFVSIKIDREERPDIDQIYMDAAQLISGRGGWPLNAFALPDGKPFYAATYFPRQQWVELLTQVKEAFKNDHENVVQQAEAVTNGIQANAVIKPPAMEDKAFDKSTYTQLFDKWKPYLDDTLGGFTGAPKFPMPVVWEFLLQHHHLTGNKKSLALVTTTLNEMAKGGIYDQLGGGFARYATDMHWKVPHFEKMLYDNGQLVSLYAHAYQVTKDPLYAAVIKQTLDFIKRDLTSPEGGFYSSLNADSEGEEGKFYVWTKKEIESALDPATVGVVLDYYQISSDGNWEDGKNILFIADTPEIFAAAHQLSTDVLTGILADAKQRLWRSRESREHPSLDDKILVSWNALMIQGYVDAFAALGDAAYLKAAITNAHFLEKNMLRKDGGLWRNFKDGSASIEAFLDDYALLAKAYLSLYQVTFDIHWLETSKDIMSYALEHFRDPASGLYFYTSDNAKGLVARKLETADNVIPASNSVLAEVMYRQGIYYETDSLLQKSAVMLSHFTTEMTTGGPYYAQWASLMGIITQEPFEVAVMGDQALEKSRQLQKHYLPTALYMGGTEENLPLLENKLAGGRTIIYVCRNRVCKLPVEDVNRALAQLK